MAFVLATSKLADLRARVLRARWLDVQLLLDDLCQDGLPPLPSLLSDVRTAGRRWMQGCKSQSA
jgi:hypothetical protein